MREFISSALDRSRTVLLVLLLILVAGTVAFREIPKEASPDVNIPIIYVQMTHSGISPTDAERMLVRPMETELRTIEGVKEMRATAYEGGANVLLEFEAGFDADRALDDVRERVDLAKSELPADTDEPEVHEINLSLFPIINVAISGDVPERLLLRLARDLERELEGIASVLEVDIAGNRDEQVEIIIDPMRAESYGLAADELAGFIGRSNRLVAAGALDTGQGRFAIKVPGLLEDVRDIMALPVKVSEDAVVRVADIASVRHGFADAESFARIDGDPALVLEVSKRTGTNIIDTVREVRAVVERARQDFPPGVQVAYLQDQSQEIRTMLTDLQNNVIAAVLLVMVVVVAALGLRSGLLVGTAVPGSFLAAILVLAALGLTVNMVVLFALILAVGMLVDGAIVVTEYADRKMIEGVGRREAYRQAARRMATPVIASTLTTLAAFLPLLFWTGVVGEFMKFLPITLVATLTASLAMALIFVPTLGALFGRAGAADPGHMKALAAGEGGSLDELSGVTGGYVRAMRRLLRHPGKVALLALAALVAAQTAYALWGRGVEFFPEVDPERAMVQVHARGNLAVDEKNALVREVEARLLGLQGVETVYARAGAAGLGGENLAPDVIGVLQLEFASWEERGPARAIMAEARRRTADLPGVLIEVREQEQGPPTGKPVQVQLAAQRPELLDEAVATVRRGMEELGGFVDVEDTRPLPGIQWNLLIDRAEAARYGTDVATVGEVVKLVTRGLKFTDYRPEGATDEVDILARFPETERSLEQLDRLRVNTRYGMVPLSNFVERVPQARVGEIDRVDGRRVMTVKADVAEGLLVDDQVRALNAWLVEADLPAAISYVFKGENEEQEQSSAFLGKAFVAALMLITVILVTQFNSFYSALLILTAVMMSTIGVMLGLLVTGKPFGIVMSGVGVIALAGIVVNNNIVLIDTFDRIRRQVPDPLEAVLRTGAQRLRPVLLTTITTALGLLPMMLGINIDFVTREVTVGAPSTQWWTQLSTTIVAGLLFATVLTLAVTPSLLMLRENVIAWNQRRRTRRAQRRDKAEAASAKARSNGETRRAAE